MIDTVDVEIGLYKLKSTSSHHNNTSLAIMSLHIKNFILYYMMLIYFEFLVVYVTLALLVLTEKS